MNTSMNISHFRKKLNKSQENLAEALNVSRQAVAKWETGESLPDVTNLVSLSKIFGVSIDDLVNKGCNQKEFVRSVEPIDSIITFLCKAKKSTYAGKGKEINPSRKKSHDLQYIENDLEYFDTYLGGEKFAGEEGLWKAGIPFWSMNYCGRVLDNSFSGDFLKEALLHVSEDMPYRGPEIYKKENKTYVCSVNGDFDWFNGIETIYHDSKKVYECIFHGGDIL
jgi:transcriptional regulator with XRE-family HTH domain